MFSSDALLELVNSDMAYALGKSHSRAYQKYCGRLTLEQLFTTDSVYICAKRCASGYMNKRDTLQFMRHPWLNAMKLRDKVLSGTFKPTYYRTRKIMERGKARLITPPTFECKVVQKVLCEYLIRPLLEPKMLNTCYASVRGKGTAVMYDDIWEALNNAVRSGMDFEIILFDYCNYFGSIDTSILISALSLYICDFRILNLISLFFPNAFGLSLGSEISQIPASWFPSQIDHYFHEVMGIDVFRYMDDTLMIVPKEKTETCIRIYQRISRSLHLNCPNEKINIIKPYHGFCFCKERFVWDRKGKHYDHLINPTICKNEACKIKHYQMAGIINTESIHLQIQGVLGSIQKHRHTIRTVKQMMNKTRIVTKVVPAGAPEICQTSVLLTGTTLMNAGFSYSCMEIQHA